MSRNLQCQSEFCAFYHQCYINGDEWSPALNVSSGITWSVTSVGKIHAFDAFDAKMMIKSRNVRLPSVKIYGLHRSLNS